MYPHWEREHGDPLVPRDERDWFEALIGLARYLRTPDGCPWDREQAATDFARFTRGEVEELEEALAGSDPAHAAEEFGDAFFCLLAVAAAAEEQGLFRLDDALRAIHEKMIRRHEHVFGEVKADTPEDAVRMWAEVKAREKAAKHGSVTADGEPPRD